jgi:hypothetical protein
LWLSRKQRRSFPQPRLRREAYGELIQNRRQRAPLGGTSINGDLRTLANRPLHVFQWITGSVTSRVAADAQKSIISTVLKMEELLDQHAAYRTSVLRAPQGKETYVHQRTFYFLFSMAYGVHHAGSQTEG